MMTFNDAPYPAVPNPDEVATIVAAEGEHRMMI
jgi:hypothetical protein